jgi:LAO/AO transport system kinase
MAFISSSELVPRVLAGEVRAVARLITRAEMGMPECRPALDTVFRHAGRAHIVGITGVSGSGKSTLVAKLVAAVRQTRRRVAIIAIDPSSPFSGGAVLGDRVRMTDHYRDPGVYIRSLSTRGHHGGLSRAAREIVKLLDAFGYDIVMIETVGVGQTELSVMDLADTTVVVTVPEGGDGVQVMKAGLNEIADLFVVNKADRDGADRIKAELELSVHLRPPVGWRPLVLMTQASNDIGIDALVVAITRHGDYQREHRDPARDRERRTREFIKVLTSELEERTERALKNGGGGADQVLGEVREGSLNPYSAARRIIEDHSAISRLLDEGGPKSVRD